MVIFPLEGNLSYASGFSMVRESTPEWRHEAARVKATSRLSLADAWVSSLAILYRGQLIHKDPEFDQVDGLEMLRLPYKTGTA